MTLTPWDPARLLAPSAASAALLLASIAWPAAAQGFRNVSPGDVVPNATLPVLGASKTLPLYSADHEASLFVFFRPDTDNSRNTLSEISKCVQPAVAGKVHWVGIVSDAYPAAQVAEALKAAAVTFPILVDQGDALYGKLGAFVLPSLGVVDRQGRLSAYQPFRKVNLCTTLTAQLRFAQGKISQAELEAVLAPPRARDGGNTAVARRNLKMASMLLSSGKTEKALPLIDKAIESAPELAQGHGLKALALAHKGDCAAAEEAAAKALALDADDPSAAKSRQRCAADQAPATSAPAQPAPR